MFGQEDVAYKTSRALVSAVVYDVEKSTLPWVCKLTHGDFFVPLPHDNMESAS